MLKEPKEQMIDEGKIKDAGFVKEMRHEKKVKVTRRKQMT